MHYKKYLTILPTVRYSTPKRLQYARDTRSTKISICSSTKALTLLQEHLRYHKNIIAEKDSYKSIRTILENTRFLQYLRALARLKDCSQR